MTGFDFNVRTIRRNDFKLTVKVINIFNAPLRAAA